MVILGPLEFHGAIDAWTEYPCMRRLADGSLELSSRSRELLGYENWWLGEVVWPEGHDPDENEGGVLPLTVAGKHVLGRDGDGVVGRDLVLHSDEAVAAFCSGHRREARAWLEEYGWGRAPNFEAAMGHIRAALSARR